MSKAILVLNALILVVNFIVAWASTDSQVSVLEATARVGHSERLRATGSDEPGVTYLRMAQSLEGRVPAPKLEKLTAEQWRAMHAAMAEYQGAVRRGVVTALNGEGSVVEAQRRLSKDALEALRHQLRTSLLDEQLVRQVATAVIANAR